MFFKQATGARSYIADDGAKIEREDFRAPNGQLLRFCWVYRDMNKKVIDFDIYRNDLFDRNGIEIIDSGAK